MVRVDAEGFSYTISATDVSQSAIDSAIAGTKKVTGAVNSMESGMKSSVESIKKHWLGISAAVYAAFEMIKKGWDLAEKAAGVNEHIQLIDGLAKQYGTSGRAIVDNIKEIGDGMLSVANIAETVDSAMTKNMKPDMLYGLAEASVALNDSMKMTVDEAFKALVTAMETGKEKTLKLSTGIIDLKDRLGPAAEGMTELQKQTAFYNIIMEKTREAQKRTAGETKSVADEMEKLRVTLKELELTLGQGLIRAGSAVVGVFNLMAGAALGVYGGLQSLKSSVAEFFGNTEKAAKASAEAAAAFGARDELFKKADANFKRMTASTVELQRATVKQTAAVDQNKISEGERQKIAAETAKALDALSKVIQKYGEEQLKIGKDAFTEKLKEENATILSLQSGMESYLAVLQEVFEARIAGEKAVSEAMAQSGAKPKEVLEAQVAVLKAEKEYLVQRFGGWQQYYGALTALHGKAVEAQKTKEKELADLQEKHAARRRSSEEQMISLIEKLMIVQGVQQNSEEIYMMKRNAAQKLWDEAMAASGEARIKALEAYKQKMSELTNEVIRYGVAGVDADGNLIEMNTTLLTQEAAMKQAIIAVAEANKLITIEEGKAEAAKQKELDTVVKWESELKDAMEMAKREMSKYKSLIDDASRAIEAMDREIAINAIDNVTPAIRKIKDQLDALVSTPYVVTVLVNQVGGYLPPGDGGWETVEWARGGAFDRGDVIPFARGGVFNRPTLFPMAKGMGLMGEAGPEAVMPLSRGSDGRLGVKATGGGVIHFSPTITISGSNKSPEQLAREIVRPLRDELRRLQAVGG